MVLIEDNCSDLNFWKNWPTRD